MTTPATPRHDPRRARKAVVAASVGNVLEWYDIIVYAFMAPVLAGLFFPPKTPRWHSSPPTSASASAI